MRSAAALALTSLLLLAAACTPHASPWAHGWQQVAQQAGDRAAAWWSHPWRSGGTPELVVLHPEQELGQAGRPAELRVTLALPNNIMLELGEESSLEDILEQLTEAQGSQHPTGIELELVKRVTWRRTSPLRSALRSAAATLARLRTVLDASVGRQAQQLRHLPAAAVARPGGVDVAPPHIKDHGVPAARVMLDKDVLYLWPRQSTVEARAATAAAADATPVHEDEQRLPLTAFDDAYDDGEASPGRRLQQQDTTAPGERGADAAGDQEAEEGWPATTLFGPGRTSPELTAAQHVQLALDTAAELALGAGPSLEVQDGGPEVFVTILVLGARQQPRWQRALGPSRSPALLAPHSSVLDQLAIASRQASLRNAALGRRAAGHGSILLGPMGLPGAADPATLSAAVPPPALAVIDSLFVASLLTALVCVALLAVDVWRHGWRQPPSAAPPTSVLAPLPVVVAAEEVVVGLKACCGERA